MPCRASLASSTVISPLGSPPTASSGGEKGWAPHPSLESPRIFGHRGGMHTVCLGSGFHLNYVQKAHRVSSISSSPQCEIPWSCPPMSLPTCISYSLLHNKSPPKIAASTTINTNIFALFQFLWVRNSGASSLGVSHKVAVKTLAGAGVIRRLD